MGKARAARRDQRIMKRQVAMESRDTKYAHQKGGISKKAQARRGGTGLRNEEEAPMAVIRDGKPVWLGGGGNVSRPTEPVDAALDDDEDFDEERMNGAQKKLRALKKKFRRLQELKARRRRGEELDGSQKALLRDEAQLVQKIARFESEGNAAVPETRQDDVDDDDGDVDTSTAYATAAGAGNAAGMAAESSVTSDAVVAEALASGSRLQQRRALKRQRHQEALQRRQLSKEQKEAKKKR